jgi:mRNA interferase RelE/StbE
MCSVRRMNDLAEIFQSPVFSKQKKKLNGRQIKELDAAVRLIFSNPAVGEMKSGDLQGVRVYKYRSENQQMLLAYEVNGSTLFLYALGSHQNFYRDLKKYLHG